MDGALAYWAWPQILPTVTAGLSNERRKRTLCWKWLCYPAPQDLMDGKKGGESDRGKGDQQDELSYQVAAPEGHVLWITHTYGTILSKFTRVKCNILKNSAIPFSIDWSGVMMNLVKYTGFDSSLVIDRQAKETDKSVSLLELAHPERISLKTSHTIPDCHKLKPMVGLCWMLESICRGKEFLFAENFWTGKVLSYCEAEEEEFYRGKSLFVDWSINSGNKIFSGGSDSWMHKKRWPDSA